MDYDKLIAPAAAAMRPSGIRKFFDLAAEMPECISLGVGEPDFKTPWAVREAGIESLEHGRTRYTSNAGLKELRAEIARYLDRRMGLKYDPAKEVLVTVGGSEAIDLTIRAVVQPGDEVIIPEPCFVCYEPITQLTGGVPVHIATRAEDQFRLTADQLRAAITPRTKLLIFPYPNNPTGAVMSAAEMEEIAAVLRETNVLVLSDEIYSELTYGLDRHVSIASLPGMAERTVTLNSFSKNFLMTGWRVGVMIAPAELISVFQFISNALTYTAPSISQRAAIRALALRNEIADEYICKYRDRVFYASECIEKLPYLTLLRPRGTFYLFPGIARTGMTDQQFCQLLLEKAHILAVPGSVFGKAGQGHFRIACTVSDEKLREAMERLKDLSACF